MTTETTRALAKQFYKASAQRDTQGILALIADDVDWLVQGPVDVFPFFGQRHGKAAVLEGYGEIARKLEITGYQVESLLADGDRAAALIRITAIVRATSKVMSFRTTQFSRFRDGKMIEMRGVLDSFDMVEQTIGRTLNVPGQGGGPASAI